MQDEQNNRFNLIKITEEEIEQEKQLLGQGLVTEVELDVCIKFGIMLKPDPNGEFEDEELMKSYWDILQGKITDINLETKTSPMIEKFFINLSKVANTKEMIPIMSPDEAKIVTKVLLKQIK